MIWIWILLAALVVVAGVRYRLRLAASRRPNEFQSVDDAAIREILEQGRLRTRAPGDPLDMTAAAEAEEQFWEQSWDEPEEYRS